MIGSMLVPRLVNLTIVICGIGLLAACSSTAPPVRYYRLEALEWQPGQAGDDTAVLTIGPVTFPDYLQRAQLVRRGSGAEMQVDEFNRWAEPLDEAVPRILAANIDGLTPNVVVVPATRRTVQPHYRLFATVHRLDTDASGHTELAVQWGITDRDGAGVVAPTSSRYQARATPADAADAMADAVSSVLAQFSRDVAATLSNFAD